MDGKARRMFRSEEMSKTILDVTLAVLILIIAVVVALKIAIGVNLSSSYTLLGFTLPGYVLLVFGILGLILVIAVLYKVFKGFDL